MRYLLYPLMLVLLFYLGKVFQISFAVITDALFESMYLKTSSLGDGSTCQPTYPGQSLRLVVPGSFLRPVECRGVAVTDRSRPFTICTVFESSEAPRGLLGGRTSTAVIQAILPTSVLTERDVLLPASRAHRGPFGGTRGGGTWSISTPTVSAGGSQNQQQSRATSSGERKYTPHFHSQSPSLASSIRLIPRDWHDPSTQFVLRLMGVVLGFWAFLCISLTVFYKYVMYKRRRRELERAGGQAGVPDHLVLPPPAVPLQDRATLSPPPLNRPLHGALAARVDDWMHEMLSEAPANPDIVLPREPSERLSEDGLSDGSQVANKQSDQRPGGEVLEAYGRRERRPGEGGVDQNRPDVKNHGGFEVGD